MSHQLQSEGKKNRTSFWGKLFGTAKKSSNKDKSIIDVSFARNSSLYHSFHCSNAPPPNPQEEGEVFTTLENSALAEMHKDAGIIFLNKNPLGMGGPPKDDDKKVQFVPTPQNKYYHVDVKAAPSKRSSKRDENKENLLEQSRPSKPILRFGKSQENVSKREEVLDVGGSKVRPNVDDHMMKNAMTNMPRTSTKLALFDRKNGSMPHLNVSGIPQYGSLPRSMAYRGDHPPTESRSDNTKHRMTFPTILRQRHASDAEYNGQLGNRIDKNPRLSIQDLPRQFEQNSAAVKLRSDSNYNISHRQSIGDPLVYARNWGCGNDQPNYGRNQELGNTSYEKAMQQCRGRSEKREGLRKKQQVLPITSTNAKCFNQQIPNKAINEIGLPLTTFKTENFNIPKQRSRSQSPHYIPLTETFSGKSLPLNRPESNGCSQQNCLDPVNRNFLIPTMQSNGNEKWQEQPGTRIIAPDLQTIKMREDPEYSHFLGQARRQLMRSSMYSQKRKTTNKICKLKSKECEDGFSSMADDECSFNCSCSSCMLRISKESRRSKISMQPNKDDKYFFICTDIKEENETEICPDIPPREMNVEKVIHKEPENYSNKAKTWYECNDSFCTTPKVDQSTPQNKPTQKTPKDKIVESIYENITQIINSATKRNLKTQDVERMFSTPLSNSKILTAGTSGKVCRSLFSSRSNIQGTKEVISPAQSPMVFSDSVILLQEIFQKLSQECRELLRPDVSAPETPKQSGSKYVDDLVKNLKSSSSISEGDFATIIGGIAQNIFLEAKLKQSARSLTHSASLPDLNKDVEEPVLNIRSSLENLNKDVQEPLLQIRSSLEELNLEDAADSGFRTESSGCCTRTTDMNFTTVEGRELPDGWSRSPTTENNTTSSSKDDSKTSESDMQLMEDVIRLGMGLTPVKRVPKASFYACSPAKASKFKSRDVLSCKGKLKIKIYHNSGLVTVHVMRAAKLHRLNGRDLNPYIKISMVPDTAKRVHWRTTVIKGQKCPVFNQKFSFEVLDEDSSKRLVFSVWHRDFAKERSELVGCMSFSVKHVLDDTHKIDGWYRLLREGFGTQKHFAAHKKNSCYLKRLK